MMNKTDKSLPIRSAILLMAAVAVARGMSFIFSKQLLAGGMEPFNLLGVRSLIAFAVLMAFFGRRVIASVGCNHHNLTAGMLLGFVYFLIMTLELNGLRYTTAATASFIENSAVVLVPLAEMLVFSRPITSVALNNVHTSPDGDFSQAEQITHSGALLVGTYDNFTDGDPVEFLKNLNRHMPAADQNDLIFIEKTGHTYQMKNQEVADLILSQIRKWKQ